MPAYGLAALGLLGAGGLALRLRVVLTLRERHTRTLLTQDGQTIERNGPYRWVRHPGYGGVVPGMQFHVVHGSLDATLLQGGSGPSVTVTLTF